MTQRQKRTVILCALILLLLIGLLIIVLMIRKKNASERSGKKATVTVAEKNSDAQTDAMTAENEETEYIDVEKVPVPEGLSYDEKWQEGYVRYNGNVYKYNNSIRTYLFMGIDNDGVAVQSENYVSGGQADAMFLMVVDDISGAISVIAINRNTMTDITLCDLNGKVIGKHKGQLCLQHAYGDGLRLSCQRTAEAVSYLFYNIPIAGYFAMNMGGLPILNDSVGGVTIVPNSDFESKAYGLSLKEGEEVKLSGKEAYGYIRYRDTTEFDSASARLERNELYLSALLKQMEKATGGSKQKALDIYDTIGDYTVSNIEFAYVAEDISKYGFSDDRMYTLQGETKMGSTFEEFFVEEKYLYDLILKIFYVIVS